MVLQRVEIRKFLKTNIYLLIYALIHVVIPKKDRTEIDLKYKTELKT